MSWEPHDSRSPRGARYGSDFRDQQLLPAPDPITGETARDAAEVLGGYAAGLGVGCGEFRAALDACGLLDILRPPALAGAGPAAAPGRGATP